MYHHVHGPCRHDRDESWSLQQLLVDQCGVAMKDVDVVVVVGLGSGEDVGQRRLNKRARV